MKGVGHNDDELYDKSKNKQSGYCVRFLLTVAFLYAFFSGKFMLSGVFIFGRKRK
jgi:hypothetical protein